MFNPADFSPAIQQRRRVMPTIRDQRHPADRAPRIFADSADIRDIEPLYRAGIINGVTTNSKRRAPPPGSRPRAC